MKAPARLLAAVFTLAFAQLLTAQGKPDSMRNLLAKLENGHADTRVLDRAFAVGDGQIDELISALDDSDEGVRLNAQVVIRYLGNERGMEALARRLTAGQVKRIRGAVPVPLTEFDFDWIERQYLCADCKLHGWGVSEYAYALVLDDSARAKQALTRFVEKFSPNWLPTQASDGRLKSTDHERDLIAGAFWLTATEKKAATAKLLSVTANNDKALFQVHINMGPLAEEWFHVVAIRDGQAWRIISVTMVAQS